MATYTIRGTSHNIVYTYKTIDGKRKQQWESYSSELEAIQRKAYIDYLQAQNRASDITHEAAEYRRKKAIEKTAQKIAAENATVVVEPPSIETEDRMTPFSISRCILLSFVHLERERLLPSILTQSTLTKVACGSPKFSSASLTSHSKLFPKKK